MTLIVENKFYSLKQSKHETRNRSRPFLKLKLKEPEIVKNYEENNTNNNKD